MSLSAALHATVGTLRRRPSDLLPFYMLGAAVAAIARVGVFVGLGVAYVYLEVSGRLDAARSAIAGRDLDPPDPEQSEAFSAWVAEVAPILDPLFPPVVIAVLVLSVVGSLLLGVVLSALVSAGQIGACDGCLRGDRGLIGGIAGARRHWLTFLGAYVVEWSVWVVASILALALVVGTGLLASLALLVAVPVALLLWLGIVLPVRAVFAFVPVAVVVDDVGLAGAIGSSVGFLRRNPVEAGGYYAIAIGLLVAFSTTVGGLSIVGAEAAVAPLAFLVVSPALDLAKTGLFVADRGTMAPPSGPVVTAREQVERGVRRGLHEVGSFVRATPGLHALALGVGVAGAAMGWVAAEPLVGSVSTSIDARLVGHVPPVAALRFFANNWTVAISLAFAGAALTVPTAIGIWVNGFVLGLFLRLEVDPPSLLAFMAPHSLIEVPSLLVAGALGGYLGVVTWRAWRGRADRNALAAAMERAFWVLVGLGALLAVAGLIEAFVSPYYFRPFF